MVAFIALLALLIPVGVIVGVTALTVGVVKAIVRPSRRSQTTTHSPMGETDLTSLEDQEFHRIVAHEWPPDSGSSQQ